MDTKVLTIDECNINRLEIEECGEILRNGGLVAFPTETVYGLGGNALDPKAVKKIFKAKGRPQDNPLIVHIADFESLKPLVIDIPKVAYEIMNKFCPGPITVILKKSSVIPSITTAGLDSVGIRMPSNNIARQIIRAAKVPIAAPSANISGRPSPTDVERCIEDLDGKIECIVAGEKCSVGVESTIVDCTIYPPCILRPGGITVEMLKTIDSSIYIDLAIMKKPDKDFKPKAPGMKYRHYAPKAAVRIIQGDLKKTTLKINEIAKYYLDQNKVVGIMATDETLKEYKNCVVISLGSRKEISSIARNLFETLRSFDDKKVDIILSEAFEENGVGIAVMNRLKKSAGFDIINV
ncbi:MAG TPA: L-threonylcarbamoyladenylate synthase [Clostridium sp.]|uniref:L-threonylcarbamoyladenylate synthase n=1 Tax=Clostridium sp. TaxID=1506 RepID=UPI002F9417FF